MNLAIVAITSGGAVLARRLGSALPGAEIYLPKRLREEDGCRYFERPLSEVLPSLFCRFDGLVCIMATGIVVRILAASLKGKDVDPAVVVMDEKGDFTVSLLSGHLGGANDLARDLAELTGGQAVITTATDVNDLPAWDDVARLEAMAVEPKENIRVLNSLLLQEGRIALLDEEGRVGARFAEVPGVEQAASFPEAMSSGAAGMVIVTHRILPDLAGRPDVLFLRPRNLVVGLGCNRGTSAEEIEAVVKSVLESASLSFGSLAGIATIDAKADEEGILLFARRNALPVHFHSATDLNAVSAPSAASSHALAAVGAKGVCEPAALLSAGGPLLVPKQKSGNVTVAVALKMRSAVSGQRSAEAPLR